MNKEHLKTAFERMTPNEEQKSRIKENILLHGQPDIRAKQSIRRRFAWLLIPAFSLALALIIIFNIPFGETTSVYAINLKVGEDGTVFKLADMKGHPDEYGTSVSYVDSRPGLEFYIEGDNIASIHITTKNEYIYAVDWTKTQHEKFWNVEYYQQFDEERQISIADFNLLYDKVLTMNFDDNFSDYDKIWYRWTAWDMHKWASGNNFSRFYGVGYNLESANLSEQEKAELAAGQNSAIGHMQLKDYPEHLKEDTITITITDRQGNQTTKVIQVKVDNNELGQTVVTANLVS